mmetsp:Transcript_38650/g.92462  ORF Transcript_38650/g.92462 Transcript_38650/m.92462 type:complete len:289 (-) Transcript_38650:2-868(-)
MDRHWIVDPEPRDGHDHVRVSQGPVAGVDHVLEPPVLVADRDGPPRLRYGRPGLEPLLTLLPSCSLAGDARGGVSLAFAPRAAGLLLPLVVLVRLGIVEVLPDRVVLALLESALGDVDVPPELGLLDPPGAAPRRSARRERGEEPPPPVVRHREVPHRLEDPDGVEEEDESDEGQPGAVVPVDRVWDGAEVPHDGFGGSYCSQSVSHDTSLTRDIGCSSDSSRSFGSSISRPIAERPSYPPAVSSVAPEVCPQKQQAGPKAETSARCVFCLSLLSFVQCACCLEILSK